MKYRLLRREDRDEFVLQMTDGKRLSQVVISRDMVSNYIMDPVRWQRDIQYYFDECLLQLTGGPLAR